MQRAQIDDPERAMLIKKNPQFIEQIGSIDFLKEVAHHRYTSEANGKEIMSIIEASLSSHQFNNDLKAVVEMFDMARRNKDSARFIRAEADLREVLVVFRNAEGLKPYHRTQCLAE